MSDLNELLETAETIRTNVLPESNTHELIGGHLKNIINYFESKKISTEKIVSTKGNETTAVMSQKAVTDELNKKQDTLKSGSNIKTINGQSVLGAGDIEIEAGSDVSVVQALGESTTSVMSQKAVTKEVNNINTLIDDIGTILGTIPVIVQESGSNDAVVMSQKAVTDELNKKQDKMTLAQTTGDSTTVVMSQKAVTDELKTKLTPSDVTTAIENYLQHFLNSNFVALEDISIEQEGSNTAIDLLSALNYTATSTTTFNKKDGNYVGKIKISRYDIDVGSLEHVNATNLDINYILISSKQEWTGGYTYGSPFISFSNILIACEKTEGKNTDDTKLRFFQRTVGYNVVENELTDDVAFQGDWEEFDLGGGSGINVVQEKGDSTTDVMSQKAVTDAINSISVAGTSIPVSGIMNLTSASTAIQLGTIYAGLANNTLRFYVVGDSSGTLPSDESYVTVNSTVKALIGAGGASVGDILIVGKLSSKPVYKLLPLNDAKAASGSFPGADGLETVWDKTQINKISGIEITANANNSATRDGSNMNDCLQTGFYVWCTLGRPSGATGAFSLIVRRSTTPDFNGNYTVEQTCFGREAELGQIYTRLIFDKGDGSTAEYMDWKRIDRSDINVVQSTGDSTTDVMSQNAIKEYCNIRNINNTSYFFNTEEEFNTFIDTKTIDGIYYYVIDDITEQGLLLVSTNEVTTQCRIFVKNNNNGGNDYTNSLIKEGIIKVRTITSPGGSWGDWISYGTPGIELVNFTGSDSTKAISQKAATDAINEVSKKIIFNHIDSLGVVITDKSMFGEFTDVGEYLYSGSYFKGRLTVYKEDPTDSHNPNYVQIDEYYDYTGNATNGITFRAFIKKLRYGYPEHWSEWQTVS